MASKRSLPMVALPTAPADLARTIVAMVGAHTDAAVDAGTLDAAFRAWSVNTRRAFRADLALWLRWCGKEEVAPGRAGPEIVARWIRSLAGLDSDADPSPRAMATIERYLVHVGRAYRLMGLADPTAAERVRLELKATRHGLRVRQRQAHPIRFKGEISDLDSPASGLSLVALLKACRRDALGYRDAAILRLAYDTGVRRAELVRIVIADIEGTDADGAGILFIPTSKTDRKGEGAHAYLAPATMTAIAKWRAVGDIHTGPLFRRVVTHFDGSIDRIGSAALHANSVALIFKRLVRTAGTKQLLGAISEAQLERMVSAVSSHSIRVGVAQDNFAAGESLPAIMQAYRWRDARTVLRYGTRLAAKSGASARLAQRFSQEP
jgi:integrase